MIDLDDQGAVAHLDSLGVLGAMETFPEQLRDGWAAGKAISGAPSGDALESIVVLGMGGSGSAGDIVRTVIEPRLPVPFLVEKGYGELPSWVGRNTLVFAVSYSGNTEETIEALFEAHKRGSRLVTISSGGRLAHLGVEFGSGHVGVPPGRQPRASLGYLAMPILSVLEELGVVADLGDDLEETLEIAAAIGAASSRTIPAVENPAKALGKQLAGKVPMIYGGRGIGAAAAYRFKCDLNEYAKIPAFSSELPEANHNEIVGFDSDALQPFAVFIRDQGDHARVARRFEITESAIERRLAGSATVRSDGESRLARILSLVAKTQFAAIYAGLAAGVDPGPVASLDAVKEALGTYDREGEE